MADNMQRYTQHLVGSKKMAIISGVIMAILGILFFIFPLASMLFAGIFIILGLLVYGIYLIVSFVKTPSVFRDGWQLAQGIIMVICALFILTSSATNIVVSFALVLGFISMMVGINEIIAYTSLKGTPGAGFILASGIINVLLALFLLFAPIAAAATIGVVQGIFLCVTGISLIIEGFAKHPASTYEQ